MAENPQEGGSPSPEQEPSQDVPASEPTPTDKDKPASPTTEAAPTAPKQPAAAKAAGPETPQEKKAREFIVQAEKKLASSQTFFGGIFG